MILILQRLSILSKKEHGGDEIVTMKSFRRSSHQSQRCIIQHYCYLIRFHDIAFFSMDVFRTSTQTKRLARRAVYRIAFFVSDCSIILLHFYNQTPRFLRRIEQARQDTRFQENNRIFKQMNPSSVPHKQVAAMRPVLFSGHHKLFPIMVNRKEPHAGESPHGQLRNGHSRLCYSADRPLPAAQVAGLLRI